MFNSNQYKMKIKNCLAIVLGTAALFTVTSCGNTKVKKDGLAEVDSLATTYVNPLFQKVLIPGLCSMKVLTTICIPCKIVWYSGRLQTLPM